MLHQRARPSHKSSQHFLPAWKKRFASWLPSSRHRWLCTTRPISRDAGFTAAPKAGLQCLSGRRVIVSYQTAALLFLFETLTSTYSTLIQRQPPLESRKVAIAFIFCLDSPKLHICQGIADISRATPHSVNALKKAAPPFIRKWAVW